MSDQSELLANSSANNTFVVPDVPDVVVADAVVPNDNMVIPDATVELDGSAEMLAAQWEQAPAVPAHSVPEQLPPEPFDFNPMPDANRLNTAASFDFVPLPAPVTTLAPMQIPALVRPISTAIRPGTVVWGFIVAALGLLVLANPWI